MTIHKLVVRDPLKAPIGVHYWNKADMVRGKREFEFADGINIAYAPNGSGKSTLIKALALLSHCFVENFPRVSRDSISPFTRPDGVICDGLILEHDGGLCRYLGTGKMALLPEKNTTLVDLPIKEELDISTDVLSRASMTLSSGQAKMADLYRFLRNDPIAIKRSSKFGSLGKEVRDAALESLRNKKGKPGKQTIILDEADQNLDFPRQRRFWEAIKMLAEGGNHQIIIASHSPFCLDPSLNAHVIELEKGSYENSRAALSLMLGMKSTRKRKAA
jgi:ABC-type uncharacterized transport system ATPase subunit